MLVDGWFRTADAGRLDDDGHLQVLGRVDDVVVTGGVNVPGPAVAARLREHPDVRAAEVLGVARRGVGAAPGRLRGRAPPTSTSCATGSRRCTPGRGRRASWCALDALPELANGKPDRLALAALAAAS